MFYFVLFIVKFDVCIFSPLALSTFNEKRDIIQILKPINSIVCTNFVLFCYYRQKKRIKVLDNVDVNIDYWRILENTSMIDIDNLEHTWYMEGNKNYHSISNIMTFFSSPTILAYDIIKKGCKYFGSFFFG